MNIYRRRATIADADFALTVHHQAYRDVIERQYGTWDESTQDKFFAAAWAASAHDIVVCDDVRCGYVCIEDRIDHIYVREIVIAPDFQRRGIGTRILTEILSGASQRRVPVRLQTQVVNRAANLYRRLGFIETGRTDIHLLMEWRRAGLAI